MGDELQVAVEGETDVEIVGDVGEHDVAEIGIDAPSARFATIVFDAVRAHVVHVDFVFHQLVSAKDNGGIHLPHEETVFAGTRAGNVFFHSQIER